MVVISFTEKEREREEEKGHDITLEGEEDDLPGPGRNENVQRFEKVSGKGEGREQIPRTLRMTLQFPRIHGRDSPGARDGAS